MNTSENCENTVYERNLGRVEGSLEHLATKNDVIDKIHEELKPFHELRGEFKTLKRVFYIGLSAGLILLCKMAFAPTLILVSILLILLFLLILLICISCSRYLWPVLVGSFGIG